MIDIEKIKPCPFCGGDAVCTKDHEASAFHNAAVSNIHCINCGAKICHTSHNEEFLLQKWNKRENLT